MIAAIALLVALASPASAVPRVPAATESAAPTTFQSLLDDLDGADRADRLFAARALRGRVRHALARADRQDEDASLEAREALADFDRFVAPRCIALLRERGVVSPCADILGLLETPEAAGPLREALGSAKGCARRHLERALDRIGP